MKKLSFLLIPAIISIMLVGAPLISIAQTTDTELQDALTKLRQSRQDFKDSKVQEKNSISEEGKAKGQAARLVIQEKRLDAYKRKEEKRKEVLLKLIDIQIKWMNRTKERVQKMPNIAEELKTQLTTEVDASIQELNDEKTKIQNASEQEALKSLAQEIHNLFKSKKEIIKKIVDAILASRTHNATAKAKNRAMTIKDKIKTLKLTGKDTSKLETDLDDAEKKIDEAQNATERKAFKEANDNLKGAYQKFLDIADKARTSQ